MLVASILMMGYNASGFLSSHQALSEKASSLKDIAQENGAGEASMRRSNFLLSFFLSAVYVTLAWFSGFTLWVTLLVAAKFIFTLFISDYSLVQILRMGEFPRKIYLLSKVDAFFNVVLGLFIALFLVL